MEQSAGSRTSAPALHNATDLERVTSAIDAQHLVPLLVVLDEDGIGKSGTVGRNSRHVDQRNLAVAYRIRAPCTST